MTSENSKMEEELNDLREELKVKGPRLDELEAQNSEFEVNLKDVYSQLHDKEAEVTAFCTKFANRETTLAEVQVSYVDLTHTLKKVLDECKFSIFL